MKKPKVYATPEEAFADDITEKYLDSTDREDDDETEPS